MGLLDGKKALIFGVANDHSIAWGIASMLHQHGAELAFTYQGEAFERRVRPLAESVGAKAVVPCDVEDEASMKATFDTVAKAFGGQIDFVVHAIAYSDKEELKGRYFNTTRGNFSRSMLISCYSFTEVARLAQPYMAQGGSLITLTYEGSTRVMPNYNVMGVAKAALELVEPPATHQQLADDEEGPFLAKDLGRLGDRAELAVFHRPSPLPYQPYSSAVAE